MKMSKISTALALISLLWSTAITAQVITANQYQNKADAAFERKDYNTALAHYLTILQDEPERADIYWKTAESARLTRHFLTAEKYFEALMKTEAGKTQPLLDFKLAQVKKSLGKYNEAITLFRKYSTAGGDIASQAQVEIESAKYGIEMTKTEPYKVVHFDEKVNTFFIDAAPVYYDNKLHFTSGYQKLPTSKPVTNIFATNLQEKAMPLAINSQIESVHTAHYAPNTEGSRLYYNLCEQDEETGQFLCEIYIRDKGSDGTWAAPRKLDTATINIKGFTATQPNVGFDKQKGKDVLYFTSNRPGSKGGMDIWAADIESNGTVGSPYNLSEINTVRDEISPFFISAPQILLFSTEGGANSIGGYDIFKSERLSTGFGKIENIGYPINTSYDDMYASFSPEAAKYFFVSNRPGGMCDKVEDKDCVCNDIYFQEIQVGLEASTFLADGGGSVILKGCRVDLVDIETGEVIKYEINDEGNDFKFPLLPNRKYRLIATKKGYMSDTTEFSTTGLYLPTTTLYQKLVLKPNLKLQIYVFDKIDKKPLTGSTVEIRSEDGKILYATETLTNTNLFTWDGVEFGKKYKLIAMKTTYETGDKMRVIETWSSTITKFVYTDSIYLTPFSGLPLTLYFDNDYPDPRSRAMTSIYAYGETYYPYYNKQPEYLSFYYRDNKDVSAEGANEISEFFNKRIKYGYDKLMEFSVTLYKYLMNGNGMEIVLEGYASPLAQTDYNRILTSRRVSSVINHFYKYEGGVFRNFLTNGQLRLRVEPYGEDKAESGVSDDDKDRRNSVYSVKAMKERKVEIKEINKFEYNPNDGYKLSDAIGIYLDVETLGKLTNKRTSLADVDDATRKGLRGKRGAKSKFTDEGAPKPVIRQRHEIVFVDSYTGSVITGSNAAVELYDQFTDKVVGKGKRRGKGYAYSLDVSRDYIVKAKAAGYSESNLTKYSGYWNADGTVSTDTVYLTPFSGLPLTLYFDNDKPAGSAASETTAATYEMTYRPYYARKGEFVRQYNRMMATYGGITTTNNEMSLFFDKEVKAGYDQLAGFASILRNYLQKGYQLEIKLEGYASPLANTDYNQKLSSRRVNSVVNYLTTYGGGNFKKYIRSGQLKITIEPMGEINTTVSDQVQNAASVYSLEASHERKVVVKDIVILNNVFYKN
jgi:outer membrane protein OmpA-like peptidoglycan-associated protein